MRTLADKIIESFKHSTLIREHLFEHGISITESPLRLDSEGYLDLVNCARELYEADEWSPTNSNDIIILEKLETGKDAIYDNDGRRQKVKLHMPMSNPDRAKDKKRFVVYIKGKSIDKESGLPMAKKLKYSSWDKGLDINNDDEGAVNSFWARQQCDKKTDVSTAGWWACYTPELFGDKLKLRGGKSRW